MAANYVTSFTTDTLPTVTSTVPVNGATAVNPATTVTVSFSESVNATTASFTVQCPIASPQAFTLSASPSTTFTLTPSAPLPQCTLCTVTVVAAQVTDADAGQNMAANFVFGFTTGTAPAITSANNATFKVGVAGPSFTVTTTGTPSGAPMSITELGALPSGVTFTNNNDGTATLAGTPSAATGGSYAITITANNGIAPNATQSFTLTVNQAPAITSANNTTFTINQAGTFTVTATGFPTNASMAITETGALPAGVTLVNNNNGTATLAGTPTAGGTFPITIAANNGVTPNATQSFTLTVNAPPAITSANNIAFQIGSPGTFAVTTSGTPSGASMSITELGALPSGVTFTNNNDGTATLAGTPAPATGCTYPITITANNGNAPNATHSVTLTVNQAPTITSANNTTFTINQAGTFTVTATGFPTNASMAITETGALPAGVTLANNNNGTATLAGTPTAGGTFPITIAANNGVTPNATQSFTLAVNAPPGITSANNATYKVGVAGPFFTTTSTTPTGAPSSIITLRALLSAGT